MSIEQQAEQLAQWLEAHPGTLPPDGIDPEVIEAVYSLRPELAPAPNVDLDDILDSVERGPFQVQTEEMSVDDIIDSLNLGKKNPEAANTPLGDTPAMAEVIQLSQRRQSLAEAVAPSAAGRAAQRSGVPSEPTQRLNISPRFLLGSIGGVALLAAACALFILVPALQGSVRIQPSTPTIAQNTDSAKPAPAKEDIIDEAAPRSATEMPTTEAKTADGVQAPSRAVASTEPEARTRATEPSPARDAEPADAEMLAVTERITKQAAVPTQDTFAAQTAPSAMEMDDAGIASASPPRARRAMAREKVASVAVEDSPERAVVGQWKALVAPYPKDWTAPTLNAREQSIVANAEALEANSDWTGAAQVYQQAIPLSKSQVGQYFAAEATLRFLNATSTSKAIKAANRCVALSAQNTAQLSRCYCVLGDAYQAAGDEKKARAAYEKADRLNRKR